MIGERSNGSRDEQPAEDGFRHRAKTYLGLGADPLGREFREALKAGVPPADPTLHEPLRRMLAERRAMHEQPWSRWSRRLSPVLFGFIAIVNLIDGLSGEGWLKFVAAAGFAVMPVFLVGGSRVERRHIDRLQAALPPAEARAA